MVSSISFYFFYFMLIQINTAVIFFLFDCWTPLLIWPFLSFQFVWIRLEGATIKSKKGNASFSPLPPVATGLSQRIRWVVFKKKKKNDNLINGRYNFWSPTPCETRHRKQSRHSHITSSAFRKEKFTYVQYYIHWKSWRNIIDFSIEIGFPERCRHWTN